MQNSNGNLVTNNRDTYYPFGDYRGTPPSQTLTDRGFTGQKSNNQPVADLGLLYMNARYYLPGIGKFASADTIVPDPAGPQQFNRYAYTLNSPTRFTDPSGHCTVGGNSYAGNQENEYYQCVETVTSQIEYLLGSKISAGWSLKQLRSFLYGLQDLVANGVAINDLKNDVSQRQYALQQYAIYWSKNLAISSLEAAARTVEFASIIGGTADNVIAVLSGHVGDGIDNIIQAFPHLPNPSDFGPFNTQDDFHSDGFNDFYRDPDPSNNQVHHTMYYVQLAYYNMDLTAYGANYFHEYVQNVPSGQSIQDYRAGQWGIDMGHNLQNSSLTLRQFAYRMRVDLGE